MFGDHILDFFKTTLKPRNDLHVSVFNALQDGTLTPILRSLGIIDKFVTGPWMRWQGTRLSILQTSCTFQEAFEKISSKNGANLVGEFEVTAFGTPVKKDANYSKLTTSTSTSEDVKTAEVINILLREIADVMKRQLADHLKGGKYTYSDSSQEVSEQAVSCSSNNISGERIFGASDTKSRQAPTAKPS